MISQNTLYIIITLVVVALPLEWYTYRGIQRLTRGWPHTQKLLARRGYWVLMAALVVSPLITLQQFRQEHRMNDFAKATVSTTLTMLATKLAFVLVLFGEDIYRWGTLAVRYVRQSDESSDHRPSLPERRRWVNQMALVVAGVPFASFLYGITRGKYDFRVHRPVLYFDDLPEAFDGFTITQLPDIQSGSFDISSRKAVQQGVDLAQAQESDLFLFTGDLVNNVAEEVEPWLNIFGQLWAPYGQFSTLGNHDYGEYISWPSEAAKVTNLDQLVQYHDTLGYQLLNNTHVMLEKDGQ